MVHLVGRKGLIEGDKPDSLSNNVTFLRMLSNRFSRYGENRISRTSCGMNSKQL